MDGKGTRTAGRHGCTHSQVQVPWNRLELGFSRQSHRVAEHFRRKDVDMRVASSQLRFCREGEAALEMKLQPANTGFIGTMQRLSGPMWATFSPTAHCQINDEIRLCLTRDADDSSATARGRYTRRFNSLQHDMNAKTTATTEAIINTDDHTTITTQARCKCPGNRVIKLSE
jgi:hypothetical protein